MFFESRKTQNSPLSTFSTMYLYPEEKWWLPTAFLSAFLNKTLFSRGSILSIVALSAVHAWKTTKSTPLPDFMDGVQSPLMSPRLYTKPFLFTSSHSYSFQLFVVQKEKKFCFCLKSIKMFRTSTCVCSC